VAGKTANVSEITEAIRQADGNPASFCSGKWFEVADHHTRKVSPDARLASYSISIVRQGQDRSPENCEDDDPKESTTKKRSCPTKISRRRSTLE
jgi:hypothetical protein